ncbi:hypothetical protein NDU88_007699 [Pleurodeles waltl]|uniref:Uncharacterized protein n=1 Tax=Pleurodeles waltl TaxID=8319 RepID=A0AAV7N2S1_PLEWA|nr:hypothetical protein NDU88_007699 [Pleurodeles waltl]
MLQRKPPGGMTPAVKDKQATVPVAFDAKPGEKHRQGREKAVRPISAEDMEHPSSCRPALSVGGLVMNTHAFPGPRLPAAPSFPPPTQLLIGRRKVPLPRSRCAAPSGH